jgi:hypothetical protein
MIVMSKKKAKKKIKPAWAASRGDVPVIEKPGPEKTPPTITSYPTAGRKVTEFEERLDAQLAGGVKKPARGSGGKFSSKEPAAGPEIDITVIGQVVQIPFDLWSVSQGVPELKISTDESVMLAKPVKQLLDHYVPQVPEIAWAWISLSAVSYSIMKSRLALIAEIRKTRPSSERGMDAARVANSSTKTQGHGGSHPSSVFPSLEQIQKPVV